MPTVEKAELAPQGSLEVTGVINGLIFHYSHMIMRIKLENGSQCYVKYKHEKTYVEGTKLTVQARWERRNNNPRKADGMFAKIKVIS